jgi:hypothetical protein
MRLPKGLSKDRVEKAAKLIAEYAADEGRYFNSGQVAIAVFRDFLEL